jgi:deferrochelatase/peroxidase EfeB
LFKAEPTMSDTTSRTDSVSLRVPCPAPRGWLFDDFGRSRQNGIADPRWPPTFQEFLERHREVENGSTGDLHRAVGDRDWEQFQAEYEDRMSGRMRPQEFLSIVLADVETAGCTMTERRRILAELLAGVTRFAWEQMRKTPSRYSLRPNDYVWIPTSYRVTITFGLGASLFVSPSGQDRFGLTNWMPRSLRTMPPYPPADDPSFNPAMHAADMILLVQSDHPYVNSAIVRRMPTEIHCQFKLRRIEHGFSRPDVREWLGFNDGVANVKTEPDLDRLVFVSDAVDEPEWCHSGSYLVYRKIREDLLHWQTIPEDVQERVIGRRKDLLGTPLNPDPDHPRTHLYHPSGSNQGTPLTAHSFKNNPRRPAPDLFGILDNDRNLLRRGFPYFQGVRADGKLEVGLQFLAFMKDLRSQFEWRVESWQLNPDFPYLGTGIDAMFANKILQAEGGGFYFCPPAPRPPANRETWQQGDDHYGRELLRCSEIHHSTSGGRADVGNGR